MCRKVSHPHPTSRICTPLGVHQPAPSTDTVWGTPEAIVAWLQPWCCRSCLAHSADESSRLALALQPHEEKSSLQRRHQFAKHLPCITEDWLLHAQSNVPSVELNCIACTALKCSLPYVQCLRQVRASAAFPPAMAPVPALSAGTKSFLNTRIISGSGLRTSALSQPGTAAASSQGLQLSSGMPYAGEPCHCICSKSTYSWKSFLCKSLLVQHRYCLQIHRDCSLRPGQTRKASLQTTGPYQ